MRLLNVDSPPQSPDTESTVAFQRWDSSLIRDLFLFVTTEHDLVYSSHVHDAMEIMWALAGSCEIFYRGRRYLLQAGDAVAIAPDEVHAGGAIQHSPFKFASLHIPKRLIDSLFGADDPTRAGRRYAAPLTFLSGRSAAHLYQQLICGLPAAATLDDQVTCVRDALRSLTSSIAASVCVPLPMSRHPAVLRVRTCITDRRSEAVDVCAVANEFGLNPHYLISLFKDAVGLPPHQYEIAQRIDLARCLLDDEISLSAVASIAGFADQSHFNRFFKRAYGMPPGAYRTVTVPLVAQL